MQLRGLDRDAGGILDGFGDERVAADNGIGADDRLAAQDRRPGVDRDMVAHSGVPLAGDGVVPAPGESRAPSVAP